MVLGMLVCLMRADFGHVSEEECRESLTVPIFSQTDWMGSSELLAKIGNWNQEILNSGKGISWS